MLREPRKIDIEGTVLGCVFACGGEQEGSSSAGHVFHPQLHRPRAPLNTLAMAIPTSRAFPRKRHQAAVSVPASTMNSDSMPRGVSRDKRLVRARKTKVGHRKDIRPTSLPSNNSGPCDKATTSLTVSASCPWYASQKVASQPLGGRMYLSRSCNLGM
jgi:hypothetical protein